MAEASLQLSDYINGRISGPQADSVKAMIYEIIDEWKQEASVQWQEKKTATEICLCC